MFRWLHDESSNLISTFSFECLHLNASPYEAKMCLSRANIDTRPLTQRHNIDCNEFGKCNFDSTINIVQCPLISSHRTFFFVICCRCHYLQFKMLFGFGKYFLDMFFLLLMDTQKPTEETFLTFNARSKRTFFCCAFAFSFSLRSIHFSRIFLFCSVDVVSCVSRLSSQFFFISFCSSSFRLLSVWWIELDYEPREKK